MLMQEMYQSNVKGDKDWDVEPNKDPLCEPADAEIMIGSTHVYLQSLGYLMELEETLSITDFKGNEQGLISVQVQPCITDEFVENPKDLVGKSLQFKIMITHVRGLPSTFQKSFCRYKFYLDEQWTQTDEMPGINPDFKHEKKFSIKHVTQQHVDYLVSTPLVIEVLGKQKENKPAGGDTDAKPLICSQDCQEDEGDETNLLKVIREMVLNARMDKKHITIDYLQLEHILEPYNKKAYDNDTWNQRATKAKETLDYIEELRNEAEDDNLHIEMPYFELKQVLNFAPPSEKKGDIEKMVSAAQENYKYIVLSNYILKTICEWQTAKKDSLTPAEAYWEQQAMDGEENIRLVLPMVKEARDKHRYIALVFSDLIKILQCTVDEILGDVSNVVDACIKNNENNVPINKLEAILTFKPEDEKDGEDETKIDEKNWEEEIKLDEKDWEDEAKHDEKNWEEEKKLQEIEKVVKRIENENASQVPIVYLINILKYKPGFVLTLELIHKLSYEQEDAPVTKDSLTNYKSGTGQRRCTGQQRITDGRSYTGQEKIAVFSDGVANC